MKTNKLSALFMILAIILSIAGFTYGHWSDKIRIEGSIEMAHILVSIKSAKVLISPYVQKQYQSYAEWEISPDEHTLEINSTNLGPSWYIWVGLIMQNQGPLPGQIKSPQYIFEDEYGFKDYFETKEYIYGAYPENTGLGNLEVWGKVEIDEQLKPDGTVDFPTEVPKPTPLPLDPMEKAVVWIWIHVIPDVPPTAADKTVKLYIEIVDDIAI